VKQGQATHSGSGATKVEPVSKAISPAWTAQVGISYGTHTTDGHELSGGQQPMTTGPGLRAPMVGETSHKAGSQGRR